LTARAGLSFNSAVPDLIELASSGRAKCRGCGRPIAARELRFGESLPNPYAEGEALYWFHLPCAALMRPEKLLEALPRSEAPIEEKAWLEGAARFGVEHPRLPRLSRAERAASGRAHCRLCRELIEKGNFRLGLQMFEEGRFAPIGTIHLGCAEAYFGTAEILERIVRLTPGLGASDVAELEAGLSIQRPAPADVEGTESDAGSAEVEDSAPSAQPGLAKATPELQSSERPRAGRRSS
jgi:hypothetical protein